MKQKFAIVVSEFNEAVTSKLLEGTLTRLYDLGVNKKDVYVAQVPGAVEIPLTAKLIAKSGQFNAIICLGAVIRGDTDHYDYVCDMVSQGCQQVMLEFNVPVIFGVLTTHNEEQALARAGGSEGNKGAYCADAAIRMAALVEELTVS